MIASEVIVVTDKFIAISNGTVVFVVVAALFGLIISKMLKGGQLTIPSRPTPGRAEPLFEFDDEDFEDDEPAGRHA